MRGSWVIFVILIVALLGASGYFFMRYRGSQREVDALKQDPQKAARESTRQLAETVGKLVVLPEGEEPTVATVTDPEKLKDQPFFSKAQKDDKVLIYTTAKKAYLYNPASNKVVEVATLNINTSGTPAPTSPRPTPR